MSYHERVKRDLESRKDATAEEAKDSSAKISTKLKGWALSIVAIIIVYGLINLLLLGGQSAFKSEDEKRFESLKSQIESEKALLDSQDARITSEENDLLQLKQRMDSYKAFGNVGEYNHLVDQYNVQLASYTADIDNYNSKLPAFNSKVEEANNLAKSVGSTWYLVPIPTGKHSAT